MRGILLMNARTNGSNESGKNVIPTGETTKYYNDMLQQALAQTKGQALRTLQHTQAARENLRRRDNAFQSWFAQKPIKEASPATVYQQHMEAIEQAPTTVLPPLPHQTDALDISLEPTRIQENWNPQDLLAEMLQKEHSPSTERITKRLSMPLPGPLDIQPLHHIKYTSDSCALRTLVSTGVDLYIRDHQCNPSLIEISVAARSLLPVIADWEEGYPYQSSLIPIVGNPQLEVNAVRCWGN